jgi:G3E family GTPase
MIVNVIYGFLGAGKTTFIRQVMEQPSGNEKVVILVNEFGEVGIDGIILASAGLGVAEVVELPSGCICCTMASDFRRQFVELHSRFKPDRMIIEPTGLATISQITQILQAEDIQPYYSSLRMIHVVDASEFVSFVKSHRHFMENQIRGGRVVLLNKIDKVKPAMVAILVNSIKEINPEAAVYHASFSRLPPDELRSMLGTSSEARLSSDSLDDDGTPHDHDHEDEELAHEMAHHYQSIGRTFSSLFSRPCLEGFFEELREGHYGEVVRAKGVFRTREDWIKLEIASGEVRVEQGPLADASVVSIIGHNMKIDAIDLQLTACQAEQCAMER